MNRLKSVIVGSLLALGAADAKSQESFNPVEEKEVDNREILADLQKQLKEEIFFIFDNKYGKWIPDIIFDEEDFEFYMQPGRKKIMEIYADSQQQLPESDSLLADIIIAETVAYIHEAFNEKEAKSKLKGFYGWYNVPKKSYWIAKQYLKQPDTAYKKLIARKNKREKIME